MNSHPFQPKVFSILLTLFFLLVCSIIYSKSYEERAFFQVNLFDQKAAVIREHLNLSSKLLTSLAAEIEHNLSLVEQQQLIFPEIKNHAIQEDENNYAFDLDSYSLLSPFSGRLSAIGQLAEITPESSAEMIAVLASEHLFRQVHANVSDILWLYYTSQKEFIYLTPEVSENGFQLTKGDFRKAFWQQATPKHNPNGDLIITDLYEDAAGKGLMMSMSLPITHNHRFKGVLSLDFGIVILNLMLSSDTHLGEYFIVDEQGHVIASANEAMLGTDLALPINFSQQNISRFYPFGDHEFMINSMFNGELRLVQRVNQGERRLDALKHAAFAYLILILLTCLIIGIYQYLRLKQKVNKLAFIDPMTQLMNERSLKVSASGLMKVNQRVGQKMSMVLCDLDLFNRINQHYNHDIGDEVIAEIANELKLKFRQSDLISRHIGDAFLVALPNTEKEHAVRLSEEFRTTVENETFSSKKIAVTLSVACIECEQDETFDNALKRLEVALSQAKELGRNTVVSA